MANHIPAHRPHLIDHIDPTAVGPQQQQLWYYPAAQAAARRHQDRILYARWAARQAELAEHDRKVRRLLLRLFALLGVAILAGTCLLAWFAWQAITALGAGILAIPLIIAVAGLLAGRRCTTIVQHWH
jgi:hypothetical protein